jgi:hypothetical protein
MTPRYLRASRIREALIFWLGGKCSRCGAGAPFEMHLIKSDGGKHHQMNGADRVYFYAEQSVSGNVELLCVACHRGLTLQANRARRLQRLFPSC